ncbi:microfibril-associated glycoprotein 4-like [Saccostrea cucullata]|uniref:microfibril-associated glycoprotein 4-like n=1 Tax=Saccostrea cuccullata TaxID=36930 RepID=UPI002ED2AF4A
MGAICSIVLVFAFFAVCQSTVISRKYTANLELNDKKSNEEFLEEYNSTSVIECGARCQRECSFYGFNPQMKKCRTHKKIFTSGVSNEGGWIYYSHDFMPSDCKDLQSDGYRNSGVYVIYPHGTTTIPVPVYCDMTTLGNDFIHQLTKENSSLYVSITLENGTTLYEMYDRFSVSNETGKYQLFLAGPSTGTLGDSMLDTGYPIYYDLSGMDFSTPDRDNDVYDDYNCAASNGGGWWFNICHRAFLNGRWSPGDWVDPWSPTVEWGWSVRGTLMMIKRH